MKKTTCTTLLYFVLANLFFFHAEFNQHACHSVIKMKPLSESRWQPWDGELNFSIVINIYLYKIKIEKTWKKSRSSFMHERGSTEFSGSQSQVLRHVTLSIVSQGNCTSSQMCSYAPRKDTCQSDSGLKIYACFIRVWKYFNVCVM